MPDKNKDDPVTIDKNVLNTLISDQMSAFVTQLSSQVAKEGVAGEKTTRSTVESDISDPGHAEAMQASVVRGDSAAAALQLMMISGDYSFNNMVRSQAQTVTHAMDLAYASIAKKLDISMVDHGDASFDRLINIDEQSAWLNRIFRNENFADALQVAMTNFVNAVWEKILEVKEEA